MARVDVPSGEGVERVRMWSLAPAFHEALKALRRAAYESSSLSPREREVARMRLAQINQCDI